MICVCGYEFEHKYKARDSGYGFDEIITKGKENFIKIEGQFHIEGRYRGINLFACPICSTIKMVD